VQRTALVIVFELTLTFKNVTDVVQTLFVAEVEVDCVREAYVFQFLEVVDVGAHTLEVVVEEFHVVCVTRHVSQRRQGQPAASSV